MITFKYDKIILFLMKKKGVSKKAVKRNTIGSKKIEAIKIIKKSSRVKTGVKNLDPLIQGGLKSSHINLVVGSAGSGKTIFAMQFLMEGLKAGESCIYITFEEKKEKLYHDMTVFGWNFDEYEKKKKLFYLEYNPEQVKSLIEEGGGTIDQIITEHKITRLVIDSVTSFSLLYQDELAKKEAGLALFGLINKWGCTAVLTSQATEIEDQLRGASLQFEADCIILLYHFKQKGERRRAIEILKMRGTNHTNKTMAIEIISQKGLVVFPNKVIDLKSNIN
ncbi:hypothetical protein COY27_04440 [Candidatus Woesearchaeota archaeon CG_4_10_14_0_2_um_filter_33_13]|nr:MAG: hypothetical protein COY27_04440 [Candidatus Woesearchaeota archaeon CG_4_10_14_0_2_um_filter_33_13]